MLVKNDNPDFKVTMSSYDGAEACELVGLFYTRYPFKGIWPRYSWFIQK